MTTATNRILIGAGFALAALAGSAFAKPNFVVIMADDLGYGDTSVYGGWVKTPQLERMAAEGLTFTDFHTNSSVCSPTRAAFMTGRYQQRVGIVDVVASHLDTPGLDPKQNTVSKLLKQAGYRTALQGKWHLGTKPEFNPVHHGFDGVSRLPAGLHRLPPAPQLLVQRIGEGRSAGLRDASDHD